MSRAAFLRHKWPKRHAYVVEQCRVLDIRDVVVKPPPGYRMTPDVLGPGAPDLIVVTTRTRPVRRCFRCPQCLRLRESSFGGNSEASAAVNQEYLDAVKRGELSPRSLQARAARTLDKARRRLLA